MDCSHGLIGNIVIPSFVYNITRLVIMLVKLISNNSDNHALRRFSMDTLLQIAPFPACQADLEPPFSANLDENHFSKFQADSSTVFCPRWAILVKVTSGGFCYVYVPPCIIWFAELLH